MNENFSNKQIAFILFGVIVGYGIIGLPKNAAESAGTSGWICILIAGVIAGIVTNMILYLGYVHKNKTLFEYSEMLVGKYITYIFVSIYIVQFFVFFTMIIRISCETIKLTVLIETPQIILCIFFYLVAYYAVIKGLRVIVRLNELYSIIIVILGLCILISMLIEGKLINLRPFFVTSNVSTYFTNSLKMSLGFLGMELLAVIPLSDKNDKRIFKYSSLIIALITGIYILLVESSIALMGVDNVVNYKDVLFVAIRRLDIQPLQFLRRVDGIFVSIWIMIIICSIILFGYGTVSFMNKLFNKAKYNVIVSIVFFLSFIFSQIPKTIAQIEKIIDIASYFVLLPAVIIPLILLIITKVKGYV